MLYTPVIYDNITSIGLFKLVCDHTFTSREEMKIPVRWKFKDTQELQGYILLIGTERFLICSEEGPIELESNVIQLPKHVKVRQNLIRNAITAGKKDTHVDILFPYLDGEVEASVEDMHMARIIWNENHNGRRKY